MRLKAFNSAVQATVFLNDTEASLYISSQKGKEYVLLYSELDLPHKIKNLSVDKLVVDLSCYNGDFGVIRNLFKELKISSGFIEIIWSYYLYTQNNVIVNQLVSELVIDHCKRKDIMSCGPYDIDKVMNDTEGESCNITNIQYVFTKQCALKIDEYYSFFKAKGWRSRFIPSNLSCLKRDVLINNEILTDDERYNIAIFYHKQLEDSNTSLITRRSITDLKDIFYNSNDNINANKVKAYSKYIGERKIEVSDYYKHYHQKFWNNIFEQESSTRINKMAQLAHLNSKSTKKGINTKVFIVGWYGTETVGDKAILGSIIEDYKVKYNDVEFIIGSLFPYVTNRTMKELGVNAKVVNTQNYDLIKYSVLCDEIVMGGGPLMDLHFLYVPQVAFSIGKKYGKKTVVYGCGLGPLNSQKHIATVKSIFSNASLIKLRDYNSIKFANSWGFNNVDYSGDPAKDYILKSQMASATKNNGKIVACFLREPLRSFFKDLSDIEYSELISNFESSLALIIKDYVEKNEVDKVVFYHMHNLVIGGDDRDYSRYLIKKYFKDYSKVSYDRNLSTVNSISEAMKMSSLNICMRFHSVLFADTLGTNYVALDYTNGGKITGFLKDQGKLSKMRTINDVLNYKLDTKLL
ncbi:polysaccharide pyruvyl transferase family protein [Saccharicrinis aurantiacus]|uniref:polysaccharide pyruvyl transferase family protein n=1 Tax=Saccharicrinis aurantiacus TaxID=1849719 RepID=UPI000839439E|nr:polysaccharide pyruvyl transferase family protein [Saccharicrinis aurantiacus]